MTSWGWCGRGATDPLRHRRLQHRARVPDVVWDGGIPGPAGVASDAAVLGVVIETTRMFRIDLAPILVFHQLLHHGEHVVQPFIDPYLRIPLVRLHHQDVAEMNVVDAVAG